MIAKDVYIDALGIEGISCGQRVSFGMNTTMIVTGSLGHLGKGIKIGNNVGLGSNCYYGGAGGLEIGMILYLATSFRFILKITIIMI